MRTIVGAGLAALMPLLLSACVPSLSEGTYTRDQAQREQIVYLGVVERVRQVQIEGTRSGVGATAGAAVGGIAGSNVGQGRGSAVAAVVGSVAGVVVGQAAEQAVTRQPGLEITVKLDNGRMVAITQAADVGFRPGDRVRVLSDGYTSRVTH